MRAILSISILSLISAPSFAADIIFDPDPVPPIVSLPEGPFTWSGRYVGVDLGFGRGKVKESFVTENIPKASSTSGRRKVPSVASMRDLGVRPANCILDLRVTFSPPASRAPMPMTAVPSLNSRPNGLARRGFVRATP